jgi:hypothetical protein
MAQIAMIAGLGMLCLSSSVGAALMMGGGEEDDGGANNNQDDGSAAPTTFTFHDSEIPNDAMVIEPGEIPMNSPITSPKDSSLETSDYHLNFQSDGQLVWVKTGTGTAWAMGSNTTMPNTKLYFQNDGNICARGTTDICMNSAGGSRVPTHNSNVPVGQHRIVGTKEGLLYVDHGTGVEGRSIIYTPPSTTETYVLPY